VEQASERFGQAGDGYCPAELIVFGHIVLKGF
jgi:hypothetical protein